MLRRRGEKNEAVDLVVVAWKANPVAAREVSRNPTSLLLGGWNVPAPGASSFFFFPSEVEEIPPGGIGNCKGSLGLLRAGGLYSALLVRTGQNKGE